MGGWSRDRYPDPEEYTDKDIVFDPDNHSYLVNGKLLPSVTQLLQKHKITPDFSSLPIDPEKLEYARQRGDIIHAEVENYIKHGIVGMSPEFQQIKHLLLDRYQKYYSEIRGYCDEYAGTCDLVIIIDDTEAWIIDLKTGQLHKRAVGFQDGMYARFKQIKALVGNRKVRYFGLDAKPKTCRLVPVNPAPEREILHLLCCEATGKVYEPAPLIVKKGKETQVAKKLARIAKLKNQIADLQKDCDEFLEDIKKQCRDRALDGQELAHMDVTYVAPTVRETVDKDKLMKEYEEVYLRCQKYTDISDSIRVTLKEAKKKEAV